MLSEEQKNEITEVVDIVIKSMKKNHLLKNTSNAIYEDVSEQLFNYYKTGENNVVVKNALEEFKNDIYIEIIPLYYREGYTVESIAETMNVDISTIVRNKKRICMSLYLSLG